MTKSLDKYVAGREALLVTIVEELSTDERFVAGWLTGSFGRNTQDELSDLDLTLVVAEPYSTTLCHRPTMVAGKTTAERLALFSTFGQPAIIHENNNNAPEGGTFTFVMYEQSAVMVDWVLRPQPTVLRPFDSRLLWDRVGIPLLPPPTTATAEGKQMAEEVTEIIAFFWMMAAVTAKYIGRDDGVFVNHWLDELQRLIDEVKRRLENKPWRYHSGSTITLQPTRSDQLAMLRSLCGQMLALAPQVEAIGGCVPSKAKETLEVVFGIVAANVETGRV